MSCLTELYFSSTGAMLEIVKRPPLQLRSGVNADTGSAEPAVRVVPGSPMQAVAQTCLLVREAVAERMIPLALRLADLSLQFLDPLPPPAVRQLVESFQKPDSSGSNLPF